MQIVTFGRTLEEIITELELTKLNTLLNTLFANTGMAMTPNTKAELSGQLLALNTAWSHLDESEQRIAKELGIDVLVSPSFVMKLIGLVDKSTQAGNLVGDHAFWTLRYTVASTLRLSETMQNELILPRTGGMPPEDALLELEVADYDGAGVELARLAYALKELDTLYGLVSQYLEQPPSTPRIAWVDSGSKIGISVKGLAAPIRVLGSLFGDAWRGLRYRKNADVERNIQTVLRGTQCVATLREQARQGGLDAETAQKLEAGIVNGLGRLLGVGVITADLEESETFDRVAVLDAVKNVRLLGPGEAREEDAVKEEEDDDDADESGA